jgi:hypothetical protein
MPSSPEGARRISVEVGETQEPRPCWRVGAREDVAVRCGAGVAACCSGARPTRGRGLLGPSLWPGIIYSGDKNNTSKFFGAKKQRVRV